MQAQQHQGQNLDYITITPDDYDPALNYPLVLMLHGFGANMRDLASLAPAIEDKGYIYACPNAPFPFDFGGGHTGYGWMPRQNAAPPEEVEKAREQSETKLAGCFDEIFEQLHAVPGQAALLGFSQGGTMTYRCGLNRPQTFAALVALSAAVFDPQILQSQLPADRSQPIFIAHGSNDQQIDIATARATCAFLETAGYRPHYREYPIGHEIPFPVLRDLIPWLTAALPPLRH